MNKCTSSAFSLVELSIVLVILGLLVGGVLSGQSLIRAAELRSVNVEAARYSAATRAFRDKYFAIPGDMTNATAFWGTDTDCAGKSINGSNVASVGTLTCNGDGNGALGKFTFDDSTIDNGNSAKGEVFRFWQHLSNAGLIEGQYVGVSNSTTGHDEYVSGWNSPASRFGNQSTWGSALQNAVSWQWGGFGGAAQDRAYDYSRGTLVFFANGSTLSNQTILSPEQAWQIDNKADDGKPLSGKILARNASRCISGPGSPPASGSDNYYGVNLGPIAEYVGCSLYFIGAY